MYKQMNDGTLEVQGYFPTGGMGTGILENGDGLDPLGSQSAVYVDQERNQLLTINALSDTVTLFDIHDHGLERLNVASTGGSFPVSVTVSQDGAFEYVLNAGDRSSLSIFEKRNDRLIPLQLVDLLNTDYGSPPDINFTPGQVGLAFEDTKVVILFKVLPEFGGAFPGRCVVFDVLESGKVAEEFRSVLFAATSDHDELCCF